jgi:hypothetical protein
MKKEMSICLQIVIVKAGKRACGDFGGKRGKGSRI